MSGQQNQVQFLQAHNCFNFQVLIKLKRLQFLLFILSWVTEIGWAKVKELNTFKKTFFFNVILEWFKSEWERVNYSIVQTVINVVMQVLPLCDWWVICCCCCLIDCGSVQVVWTVQSVTITYIYCTISCLALVPDIYQLYVFKGTTQICPFISCQLTQHIVYCFLSDGSQPQETKWSP